MICGGRTYARVVECPRIGKSTSEDVSSEDREHYGFVIVTLEMDVLPFLHGMPSCYASTASF